MTSQEFSTTAIAILRTTLGWQSAIARRLGVNSRTVRGWLQEGHTPPWVDEKLAELMGARDLSPWPRDEWVIGHALGSDGGRREYIVHLARPRFTARIVECDDDGMPEESEMPADVLSGVVYSADSNTVLCEVHWIDEVSPGQVAQLLEAAADAIGHIYGEVH